MEIEKFPIEYDATDFVNPIHIFHLLYKELPYRKIFENVSSKSLFKKWDENYERILFTEKIKAKKTAIGTSCFKLAEGIIGFIPREYNGDYEVFILYKSSINEEVLKPFVKEVKKEFKSKKSSKNKIEVLFSEGNYTDFKAFDIKKVKIDLELNYNSNFMPIHNTILNNLSKKKSNGLVILFGEPGTGKTHYLRYLTSKLKKKKLFIPSNMASSLANPDFISKLEDNRGSVLIIEDADEILSRREGGNSAVANLLNLTDGLLADVLNIQVICTFNSSLTIIDKALLRKGRVIAKYEFKALKKEKAQKLSDKLGFDRIIGKDLTLSDIYNYNDEDFIKESKIGF